MTIRPTRFWNTLTDLGWAFLGLTGVLIVVAVFKAAGLLALHLGGVR